MSATKHQSCLPGGASRKLLALTGAACTARLLRLLLVVLAAVAQAQDYTYTTNNGTITITGYIGPGGAAAIPSTINSLPVTAIGEYAFADIATVTNIAVPDCVTNVASGAFASRARP
jgi:hypothetical protein